MLKEFSPKERKSQGGLRYGRGEVHSSVCVWRCVNSEAKGDGSWCEITVAEVLLVDRVAGRQFIVGASIEVPVLRGSSWKP